MIDEEVPAALDGERLDRIVALIADVSRSDAGGADRRRRRDRRRRGRRSRARCACVEGQQVVGRPGGDPAGPRRRRPTRRSSSASSTSTTSVIVVDKPAGLVVHPGAGNPDGTLVNGLLARFPEHRRRRRADPARHRAPPRRRQLRAARRRPHAGRRRRADRAVRRPHAPARRYEALVWGTPSAPHGIIDAPIGRDPRRPAEDGGRRRRPAGPHRVPGRRLVSARRPTLARLSAGWRPAGPTRSASTSPSIGHPLVGDPTYSERRPMLGLTRPFLHAAELAFVHPVTGERRHVPQPARPPTSSPSSPPRP